MTAGAVRISNIADLGDTKTRRPLCFNDFTGEGANGYKNSTEPWNTGSGIEIVEALVFIGEGTSANLVQNRSYHPDVYE